MAAPPDTPVSNGRDSRGRFAPGNPGGPGCYSAARVARLRAALLDAVSEEDLREVVATLIRLAKEGDTRAIKELLDRVLGRPTEPDLIERIEQLEALLAAKVAS